MDWMLTHQLSSKNLSVGEKLAMTEEFQKEVRLENERKKLKSDKQFHGNQYSKVNSTPIGVNTKNNESQKIHSETWTDNQIAKKSWYWNW